MVRKRQEGKRDQNLMHLLSSCALLHSRPQTREPHFRHLTRPQYPHISQKTLCGGAVAGLGAERAALYESCGAESKASISAVVAVSGAGGESRESCCSWCESAEESTRYGLRKEGIKGADGTVEAALARAAVGAGLCSTAANAGCACACDCACSLRLAIGVLLAL
jgi:hypothetical protein